jgi:hypothetical protein
VSRLRDCLILTGQIDMAELTPIAQSWFTVRCVLHLRDRGAYEERITLWRAATFDDAIAHAEREVRDYASQLDTTEYTGLAQVYHLCEPPSEGAEVFSLIRDSQLAPDVYLDAFFDTGSERQQSA